MDYKQTDLRVIKTKQAIKKALFELIDEIGFESITVKELTSKAKINRGTFYLHYENIDDLIDEYYDDFISKLYALFDEKDLRYEAGWYYPFDEPVSAFIVNILKFIKQNRKLFGLLWLTQGNIYYRLKFKNFVRDILLYNDNALVNKKKLLVPEPYYSSYVFGSVMEVIKEWIDSNCKESPEEIALILSTLDFKGIYVASGSQQTINNY